MRLLRICLSLFLATACFGNVNLKPLPGMPFVNRTHQLGDPVALWPFNERAGNIVQDLSGNRYDGTIATATWTVGKFGPALDFSGGGQITTSYSRSNRGLSFVCWARNSTIDDGAVFGNSDADPYSELLCMTNRNGMVTVYVGNGAAQTNLQSALGLTFSGWHQYAFVIPTITTDNIKLYHDGIEVASGVIDYSTTFTATIVPSAFLPFDELLDHCLLYNRVLSASEIALLYREPFCMFEEDNVALMALEAPTGVPVPVFYYHYINHAFLVLPIIPFGLYCYVRRQKCAA